MKDSSKANPTLNRLLQIIAPAKHVVIVTSKSPKLDHIVSGLALASLLNRGQEPAPAKPASLPVNRQSPAKSSRQNDYLGSKMPGPDLISSQISKVSPKTDPGIKEPVRLADKSTILALEGQQPAILKFLQPDEVIRPNLNSYRDLSISINKELVDMVRYSLDDQSQTEDNSSQVSIHISPFRSARDGLAKDQLTIQPGRYNIDLVIALGVDQIKNINPALTKVNFGGDRDPKLIAINDEACDFPEASCWFDQKASSVSEMIFELATFLNLVIDNSIATALLTGFISATDQFASEKANSDSFTTAARLVAIAGIERKLEILKQLKENPYSPGQLETPAPAAASLKTGRSRISKSPQSLGNRPTAARSGLGIRAIQKAETPVAQKSEDQFESQLKVLKQTVIADDGTVQTIEPGSQAAGPASQTQPAGQPAPLPAATSAEIEAALARPSQAPAVSSNPLPPAGGPGPINQAPAGSRPPGPITDLNPLGAVSPGPNQALPVQSRPEPASDGKNQPGGASQAPLFDPATSVKPT